MDAGVSFRCPALPFPHTRSAHRHRQRQGCSSTAFQAKAKLHWTNWGFTLPAYLSAPLICERRNAYGNLVMPRRIASIRVYTEAACLRAPHPAPDSLSLPRQHSHCHAPSTRPRGSNFPPKRFLCVPTTPLALPSSTHACRPRAVGPLLLCTAGRLRDFPHRPQLGEVHTGGGAQRSPQVAAPCH